ncbi:hypothetical protein RN001_010127 [Aquatica leii]|uniref:Uncharacterized protein n=1 Tax=Aquatica leii TaxID=1421715 RepID=A0AAN7S8F7_9COLE|nr:hypothetical protein RN001_010127 [Aquatica leii]
MWSYVMAAARGDQRRRPGSVFTVHSTSYGPGPCRDSGLNLHSSYNRDPSRTARRTIFASYSKDALTAESTDELSKLSRDGSKDDVLSEVRIHTPIRHIRRLSQQSYARQQYIPQHMIDDAKKVSLELLPNKLKDTYEKEFSDFVKFGKQQWVYLEQ